MQILIHLAVKSVLSCEHIKFSFRISMNGRQSHDILSIETKLRWKGSVGFNKRKLCYRVNKRFEYYFVVLVTSCIMIFEYEHLTSRT